MNQNRRETWKKGETSAAITQLRPAFTHSVSGYWELPGIVWPWRSRFQFTSLCSDKTLTKNNSRTKSSFGLQLSIQRSSGRNWSRDQGGVLLTGSLTSRLHTCTCKHTCTHKWTHIYIIQIYKEKKVTVNILKFVFWVRASAQAILLPPLSALFC